MLKIRSRLPGAVLGLIFSLFLFFSPGTAWAEEETTIHFQLLELHWQASWPLLEGEPPLLPLRQLAAESGAAVNWHPESGLIFYFTGSTGAAFHPLLEQVYLFEENPLKDEEGAAPFLFARVDLVNPLIIREGISYISSDNLVFLGMESFWDENQHILDIALNPALYTEKASPWASPALLYLLIEEDFQTQLAALPRKLGSFESRFNPGDKNRTINLKLAAAALHDLAVPAGGSFSFNTAVGPRTPQRGYLRAIIFSYGELELGYGGGICQVSSTLYNAVLEAGLTVTERHGHSRSVDYIPTGRDATVSYGYKDFRFKNQLSRPILIKCIVGQNYLKIEIWQA